MVKKYASLIAASLGAWLLPSIAVACVIGLIPLGLPAQTTPKSPAPPTTLPAQDQKLEGLWTGLENPDESAALAALASATRSQERVITFLVAKLRTPDRENEEVKRLILDLDSANWKTRDQAVNRLITIGPAALDQLRQAHGSTKSLEVKTRTELILSSIKGEPDPPPGLRAKRAIGTIEAIGGDVAIEALRQLGKDAPRAVRWYAHGACWRLAQKSVDGLLDQADHNAKEGKFDEAKKLCGKALELAKTTLPIEQPFIDAVLAKYAARLVEDPQARWLDLLNTVDPQKDAVCGKWTKDSAGLSVGLESFARLAIPVSPQGSYHVRLKFMRQAGADDCDILLPAGRGLVRAAMCWQENSLSFVSRDDKEVVGNADSLPPGGWENGREYTADFLVRLDGNKARLQFFLEGNPAVDWEGKQEELTIYADWEVPDKTLLVLGAYRSPSVFHEAGLRMLSGKAVMTRKQK
jgi:hypothetical protein